MLSKKDKDISILFINHVAHIGGAETSLIDILDNIDRKKYQAIVACPASGDLVDELKNRNIEHVTIKIDILKRTFNPLLWIVFVYHFVISTVKLSYVIKSRKVKIIHANSFTSCLFCSISTRICAIPLIWHMRDLVKIRLFNKIFISYAGLMAKMVVATTTIMKKNLISLGVKAKKICVICNGIDPSKY
ncbi:MAG: glycosyltransferase, partial [Candidatus Pacebacteria bacterium]|nr:glycosyltransferase [Candidatus Paceibacterota bacterium]